MITPVTSRPGPLPAAPCPASASSRCRWDEVRANLAKGGKGILKKLTKRDQEIIETIKSFLIENNLNFVGIDVIGDYLTEINVTSPTGLVEIANQANMNIEEIIINELS